MFSTPPIHPFPSQFECGASDYLPYPPSRPAKRPRLTSEPLFSFTYTETQALEKAAELLGVPLSRLLALADAGLQPTSTQSSPRQQSRTVNSQGFQQTNATLSSPSMLTVVTPNPRRHSHSPAGDVYTHATSAYHHLNGRRIKLHPPNPVGLARNHPRASSVPESSDPAVTPDLANAYPIQVISSTHNEDYSMLLNANLTTSDFEFRHINQLPTQPNMSQALTTASVTSAPLPTSNEYVNTEIFFADTLFPSDYNPIMDAESHQTPYNALRSQSDSPPSNASQTKKRKQRGPFQDPEQRRDTGRTRELGACISCSMQRIRCDYDPQNPKGCCLTCIKLAPARIYYLPCLRYKIPDAELLDHANCPRPTWSTRWKEMKITEIPAKHWASQEVRTIAITQDVGEQWYQLEVRQFKPTDGDSLSRKWVTNGRQRSFDCAPYAIANMSEAGLVLSDFADRTIPIAIDHYIGDQDELLGRTYRMAYQYSMSAEREEERELLSRVLRLWCASRMESRSDRIVGDETLGMAPHTCDQDCGKDCPNANKVLTPPVFSAQLEVIVVATILQPLKKEILGRLRDLIEKSPRRSWFTIYLTMFILLHSCSMLTDGDNKKARKQGLPSNTNRFFRDSVVESLHNGAKILLAFFHYANKGNRPFSMDWSSPDQAARAELSEGQVQFMKFTSAEVQSRMPHFSHIRENKHYEDDFYFISQLYDSNWDPKNVV